MKLSKNNFLRWKILTISKSGCPSIWNGVLYNSNCFFQLIIIMPFRGSTILSSNGADFIILLAFY